MEIVDVKVEWATDCVLVGERLENVNKLHEGALSSATAKYQRIR